MRADVEVGVDVDDAFVVLVRVFLLLKYPLPSGGSKNADVDEIMDMETDIVVIEDGDWLRNDCSRCLCCDLLLLLLLLKCTRGMFT